MRINELTADVVPLCHDVARLNVKSEAIESQHRHPVDAGDWPGFKAISDHRVVITPPVTAGTAWAMLQIELVHESPGFRFVHLSDLPTKRPIMNGHATSMNIGIAT